MKRQSPWDDGESNQQHLTECNDERCNYLTYGFYMSCDIGAIKIPMGGY